MLEIERFHRWTKRGRSGQKEEDTSLGVDLAIVD